MNNCERVSILQCDSYNEIKELPIEIQEFVYVSSFKIRHNQLSQLPETFWDLTKLTSLDLSK